MQSLLAERFPCPVLAEATIDGSLVGLCLFNERRVLGLPRLWVHESGDPGWDSVFIEHNGPLAIDADVAGHLLAAAGRNRAVTLSGATSLAVEAARRATRHQGYSLIVETTRPAPFLLLGALNPDQDVVSQLSRNTRQQLRRSNRTFEALGPLDVERAATVEIALDYFNSMLTLHSKYWEDRNSPGAFSTVILQRFHHELIRHGTISAEVDLLKVSAGRFVIGYLYNFFFDNRAYAYQSGFDYSLAPHGKPGLTSHITAIEWYRARGACEYDLLAGDSQYKRSLSNTARDMFWLRLLPKWHPERLWFEVRQAAACVRHRG